MHCVCLTMSECVCIPGVPVVCACLSVCVYLVCACLSVCVYLVCVCVCVSKCVCVRAFVKACAFCEMNGPLTVSNSSTLAWDHSSLPCPLQATASHHDLEEYL